MIAWVKPRKYYYKLKTVGEERFSACARRLLHQIDAIGVLKEILALYL